MKFEDTKEVKQILEKIHELVMSISPEEKRLNKELEIQENIQQDLLHEIEMANLNAVEIAKVYCLLRKNRKERRKIKDTLEFIYSIKPYTNRFVEKGILSENSHVIKKIEVYDQHIETRIYTPRVLKDLKCAKNEKQKNTPNC